MQVKGTPRISVLVITYKQEAIVSRTLDSLIAQKEYIYEICVNDDCSPDGTWKVLERYAQEYPDLVKPVRNETNVGIFRNTELSWKRVSGNLIYEIAGDDVCPEGYFKAVHEFISENRLDCDEESFCIYSDYQQIEPDGHRITYKNALIAEGHDPLKLKIRQLASARGAVYSRKVLSEFKDVSRERDFSVELAQDSQVHIFAKRNYYLPVCGCIYYSAIGISTRIPPLERFHSAVNVYEYFLQFAYGQGIAIDRKDHSYILFMEEYRRFGLEHRPASLVRMIKYYFRSIDLSLGTTGFQLDRILFVLKKAKHRN